MATTLVVAGLSDYKRREVDDKVWVLGGVLVFPLVLLQVFAERLPLELYIASILVGVLTAVLVLRFGMMGEADAIALVFIVFAVPPTLQNMLTLFPLASIVVLAGVASLGFVLYNVYYNLRGHASFPGGTPSYLKIIALMSMRFVKLEEYHRKSYMYAPVESLSIQSLMKAQQTAETPGKDKFWALVYLPYVTLLATGYLLYLFLKYCVF